MELGPKVAALGSFQRLLIQQTTRLLTIALLSGSSQSTKSHTSKPVAKSVTAGLIFAGSDLLEFVAAHSALLLGGHLSMS